MKIIIIFMGLTLGLLCGAFGSASLIRDPIEVLLRYDNGVSIKAIQNETMGLAEILCTINGKSISVPPEQLKDLANPELGGLKYTQTSVEDERVDVIIINYNRRPYEWGDDVSVVRFIFSKGVCRSELSIPTGKNTRQEIR